MKNKIQDAYAAIQTPDFAPHTSLAKNRLASMIKFFAYAICVGFFIFALSVPVEAVKKVNSWSSFVKAYQSGTDDIEFSKSIIADSYAEWGDLSSSGGRGLTIDGKKFKLDAGLREDLGFSSDGRAHFKNIEFTRFKKTVIDSYGAKYDFFGVISFTNNTGFMGGGAIHARYDSVFSFSNSLVLFKDNRSGNDSGGGAINSVGDDSVSSDDHSLFVAAYAAASAYDADFAAGLASGYAAGLAAYSTSYISLFKFENSTVSFVNNSGRTSNGGAIYVKASNIYFANSQISFTGNTAASGGAIYMDNKADIYFSDAKITFKDNKAKGVLNDVYFHGGAAMYLSGDNTLTNGIRTSGNKDAQIAILKDAILNFAGGNSDIKNTVVNEGKMVFKSGASNIMTIDVSNGGGLYLKNPNSTTKLTVGSLALKENSVLSIEIDFKKKTAPVLVLTQSATIAHGIKLEIINLTPNAAQTEIAIISGGGSSLKVENFIYDESEYKLSIKNGKLYISNLSYTPPPPPPFPPLLKLEGIDSSKTKE
jgi:predicted outer membrane repeat protein